MQNSITRYVTFEIIVYESRDKDNPDIYRNSVAVRLVGDPELKPEEQLKEAKERAIALVNDQDRQKAFLKGIQEYVVS